MRRSAWSWVNRERDGRHGPVDNRLALTILADSEADPRDKELVRKYLAGEISPEEMLAGPEEDDHSPA